MVRGRNRSTYDEKEVSEILKLYLEKDLKGFHSNATMTGITKFNKSLSEDKELNYNGEIFKAYSMDFWGGRYKGVDNFGKQELLKLKEKGKARAVGKAFESDVLDLLALIDRYHKTPQVLAEKATRLWEKVVNEKEESIRQRDEYAKTTLYYQEMLKKEKERTEKMEMAYVNFTLMSQSPGNSLNDMYKMARSEDVFAFVELCKAIDNEDRINQIFASVGALDDKELTSNVVAIESKKKKSETSKYSRL